MLDATVETSHLQDVSCMGHCRQCRACIPLFFQKLVGVCPQQNQRRPLELSIAEPDLHVPSACQQPVVKLPSASSLAFSDLEVDVGLP